MALHEIDPTATRARLDAITTGGLRALDECAHRSTEIDKQVQEMQERHKHAMDELVKRAKGNKPTPPPTPKPKTLKLGAEELRETEQPTDPHPPKPSARTAAPRKTAAAPPPSGRVHRVGAQPPQPAQPRPAMPGGRANSALPPSGRAHRLGAQPPQPAQPRPATPGSRANAAPPPSGARSNRATPRQPGRMRLGAQESRDSAQPPQAHPPKAVKPGGRDNAAVPPKRNPFGARSNSAAPSQPDRTRLGAEERRESTQRPQSRPSKPNTSNTATPPRPGRTLRLGAEELREAAQPPQPPKPTPPTSRTPGPRAKPRRPPAEPDEDLSGRSWLR